MPEVVEKKSSFKKTVRDEVKSERLGDMLRRDGHITKFQLDEALTTQKKTGGRLGQVLIALGFIDEETIVNFLSRQLNFPIAHISDMQIKEDVVKVVPYELAKEHFIFPLNVTDSTLSIAISDPTNNRAIEDIQLKTKLAIKVSISTEKEIADGYKKYYKITDEEYNSFSKNIGGESEEKMVMQEVDDFGSLVSEVTEEVAIEKIDDEEIKEAFGAGDAPIIKLVNGILTKAIKLGVSDVHIEPFEKSFIVRYRLDGSLYKAMSLPLQIKNAIISRIKIMSNLNIAERRVPQDGRIKLRLGKTKAIDFRVSVLPTLWGESIVMRILNPESLMLDFKKLGFSEDTLNKFNRAIERPQGMVIITGPTGSGKTNTLYSAINKLNEPTVKILTAEDPVEFNFAGINQVLVRNEVGMTYAAALKAFLRQDPEIILVGETRDMETAEICIKAAMTGHLVFTTLHTNDAPSSVGRIIDIGIPPYMVAAAVNLILAQRLLRRICSNCKEPVANLDRGALLEAGFTEEEIPTLYGKIMHGKGCPKCNGTGYKGRVGVYEVMEISEEIQKAIVSHVPEDQLRKIAVKEGMITLRMDALNKVREGTTTLEQALENTIITKEALPAYLLNPDELTFEDGDMIIKEGNTDKNFYQLIQGQLIITKNENAVGDISQPGEYFGEMTALTGVPRSATVKAKGKCIVKAFPGEKLKETIESYPDIAFRIINSLIRRINDSDKRLTTIMGEIPQ
ncbi:MAG: type IV-A pilus assembly ATPase PilB [Nitrospinae bacterium RIFCSPLOWO2_02_FULL_39_110]|nr:MAG: type IV-A pilus assembly ATPase PilB [Nitrospinae bacterium RIFCSPHIGHO2_02_39_11]OGV98728.1 MAG: type IV-A pilus assembly ATPase PilB [Nitrospinae bacterium RIFCSPHIGHO2_12_FULL_39_42]OGW04325.1 MAG: type IV-A pilus assembly ATPase PilB [Nitrospinae bacterium RIFCSPLOWO2_02_FULL_39_110]OGW07113.1 MAG: type IV-A pilus assembly ATPase PilB [Nitrospinae bacterium RIFCSPLOWO2_02_39_17]OGW10371.1 MAG: type IV-A pilus assembly ATPase PilB [Nitrospinae bacterium RIFCSPLOWO2_12_39_15]